MAGPEHSVAAGPAEAGPGACPGQATSESEPYESFGIMGRLGDRVFRDSSLLTCSGNLNVTLSHGQELGVATVAES